MLSDGRRTQAWSYKEFENAHVTVADKLATAMRANPHLKVHVASGYLDGATPYYATEHVLAHLQLPTELRDNIEVAYYEAGHMMYVARAVAAPAVQGHRGVRPFRVEPLTVNRKRPATGLWRGAFGSAVGQRRYWLPFVTAAQASTAPLP